jgi:hypothetical protein
MLRRKGHSKQCLEIDSGTKVLRADIQKQTDVTSKSEAEIREEIAQLIYRPHFSAEVAGIQIFSRSSYVEATACEHSY